MHRLLAYSRDGYRCLDERSNDESGIEMRMSHCPLAMITRSVPNKTHQVHISRGAQAFVHRAVNPWSDRLLDLLSVSQVRFRAKPNERQNSVSCPRE